MSIFSMNSYISPRVRYYKMYPQIKLLDHLTNQGEKKSVESKQPQNIHLSNEIRQENRSAGAPLLHLVFISLLFLDLCREEGKR